MRQSPNRDRLTAAQAERYELLNEKLRGEMIPAEDVRSEWLDIREMLKKRLSMIPIRVAAQTRDRAGVNGQRALFPPSREVHHRGGRREALPERPRLERQAFPALLAICLLHDL